VTPNVVGEVLVNGVAVDPVDASVSVFDIGFQRGYGCFEAMRVYNGVPFRLIHHLDRLARSAENLRIPIRAMDDLVAWCQAVAAPGEGVVRVFVTGGTDMRVPGTDGVTIVYMEPLPHVPSSFALGVVEAPWHPDGRVSELTGAKTLSYGPNLAATIAARSRGFDDAILVGTGGSVLEGPTFSVGWISNGTLFTPSLESNILESVTRAAALEVAADIGVEVEEGRFPIDDVLEADEVFVLSTVREVSPVVRIDEVEFAVGDITTALRRGFKNLVERETA